MTAKTEAGTWARRQREIKARTTKSGWTWNRFISVRLPPVVWTAGPQRAVFSTSAAATDGLEAWPCLLQRAHSHTTKYSWRNQAPQPPLVHITFKENTHRRALTFVCKCSCRHELVWICTNRESGPCVSKHTHTQITVSLLCRAVQRQCYRQAVWWMDFERNQAVVSVVMSGATAC